MSEKEKIAVIGLGYVGLPLALALARHFPGVTGFDIDSRRIAALKSGDDWTGEVTAEALSGSTITLSDQPEALAGHSCYIITVPTPVDGDRRPDLTIVEAACRTVGAHLSKGAVVVLESTVYPGVTEEVCGPILAGASGLTSGVDFTLGYSPERMNPGDREHTLEHIVKVVAGQDQATLERVAAIYRPVTNAGIHEAPSIQVAEAAKVIENTQRDLNIALMNELAIIFDRLEIPTKEVLEAAGTKWNFLHFRPGLVGGHCIGVDPYYLTARAEAAGYHPEVILAGRRINDGMGAFVARRLVKMLVQAERSAAQVRVGILGLTFKENVPDLRNSRVPDIVAELRDFSIEPLVYDPLADPVQAKHELGLEITDLSAFTEMDALVLAVPHSQFLNGFAGELTARLKPGGIVIDVKSALDREALSAQFSYWAL
ncbi:MAG: nucleotide sugar dehydrogenase [Pseudomonadota bacterium]